MNKRFLLVFATASMMIAAHAQISRLGQGVEYKGEVSEVGASGTYAPLWLSSNRQGLSSVENNSGYLRGAIVRKTETDSLHHWKFGYGIDAAVAYNYTSKIVVQQLYAEVQYRFLRLSVGSKERFMPLKNDELSMGGMTFSDNARPIPQVRVEIPDWWNISRHARFVWFKGHAAYGMQTDGNWQQDFVGGVDSEKLFAKRLMYHSKAGYFKFGNEERFPLSFNLGLEMVCQFGGNIWNLTQRGGQDGTFENPVKANSGLRAMFDAFIPGGSDANDGSQFSNVAGNQLGSWNLGFEWNPGDWKVRAYMDHYFEDHSQMFIQYGWKDALIGLEAQLPKNKVLDGIVYEYMNTTDQSGPVYHDNTDVLGSQISGNDNYYNHHVYGAYQHWGQVLGNPMIVSPLYNTGDYAGVLRIYDNRIKAHHIGLSGKPCDDFNWRLLLTHQASLGTYYNPHDKLAATHVLAEGTYTPHTLRNWAFTLGLGTTTGSLYDNSYGAMLKVTKTGVFQKRGKK